MPLDYILLTLILFAAALKLVLAYRLNLNWDEFLHLSRIYDYQRGTLTNALQSAYIHPFRWLTHVPGHEVEQVIGGRLLHYALALGSAWFLFLISRRFVGQSAALFTIFCYFAFYAVLLYDFSFRADGLAGFFYLAALALILSGYKSAAVRAILAAPLAAAALLTTIKSVFFLPTLGLAILLQPNSGEGNKRFRQLIMFVGLTGGLYLALHALHRSTLPPAAPTVDSEFLGGIASTVIFTAGFFPRLPYFVTSLLQNPFVWFYLFMGIGTVLVSLSKAGTRRRSLLLLSLTLPLATLLFYRNAFPYYYVFIMPTALVLCGVFFEDRLQRVRTTGGLIPKAVVVIMVASVALSFGMHFAQNVEDRTVAQREILSEVHRMFPEPVPYIDRNSMVASFPKVGFFMSTWGMENYHERGGPDFRGLIKEKQPVFLLANSPVLRSAMQAPSAEGESGQTLRREDAEALRTNYVQYWGPIYLAGKELTLSSDEFRAVEFPVAGEYTLEASRPVEMDSRIYPPGSVITVTPGRHRIRSLDGPQRVTLRWGEELWQPVQPPPEGPIFTGF